MAHLSAGHLLDRRPLGTTAARIPWTLSIVTFPKVHDNCRQERCRLQCCKIDRATVTSSFCAVVDCHQDWCGPCETLRNTFTRISLETDNSDERILFATVRWKEVTVVEEERNGSFVATTHGINGVKSVTERRLVRIISSSLVRQPNKRIGSRDGLDPQDVDQVIGKPTEPWIQAHSVFTSSLLPKSPTTRTCAAALSLAPVFAPLDNKRHHHTQTCILFPYHLLGREAIGRRKDSSGRPKS